MPGLDDHSEFDGMTTVNPVARIIKITNTNPAEIFINSYDYGKLKKGDVVRISRQKEMRGKGLFDNLTFQISSPDDDECSFLLGGDEERGFDATSLDADITGGFAEWVGHGEVDKELDKTTPAKKPSQSSGKSFSSDTKSEVPLAKHTGINTKGNDDNDRRK